MSKSKKKPSPDHAWKKDKAQAINEYKQKKRDRQPDISINASQAVYHGFIYCNCCKRRTPRHPQKLTCMWCQPTHGEP